MKVRRLEGVQKDRAQLKGDLETCLQILHMAVTFDPAIFTPRNVYQCALVRLVQRPGWEDARHLQEQRSYKRHDCPTAEYIVDTVRQNRKQASETGGRASLLDGW